MLAIFASTHAVNELPCQESDERRTDDSCKSFNELVSAAEVW